LLLRTLVAGAARSAGHHRFFVAVVALSAATAAEDSVCDYQLLPPLASVLVPWFGSVAGVLNHVPALVPPAMSTTWKNLPAAVFPVTQTMPPVIVAPTLTS